jgi:uroporphyrinogen decarboxylase
MSLKRETMISRERVLKAINHEPVDRMPIDLGMHYSTGISAFAYWNLREHLGLSTENIEIPDMVQFLARVNEDVLQRFHCDCMLLHPGWVKTKRWNPRGKYNFTIPYNSSPVLQNDGSWIVERNGRMRMPKGGYFFDGNWLNFDEGSEDEILDRTAGEAERIFKETGYFTVYIGFSAFFNPNDLDWQCRMLTDPEEVMEENELLLKAQLKTAGKVIDKMGRYIQGICINSDLGNQRGPMCRPSVYEEVCAPYVKRFNEFIHRNSDLKVFLHCCGSIKPLIPILIESGVDIINPVQISADNMDPQVLKKEFGDKITFWGGGCDTQKVLNFGGPSEVRDNVRMLVNIFKNNSGFVFNPVHNIMGNIKPENIVAMYDTAYEESFY